MPANSLAPKGLLNASPLVHKLEMICNTTYTPIATILKVAVLFPFHGLSRSFGIIPVAFCFQLLIFWAIGTASAQGRHIELELDPITKLILGYNWKKLTWTLTARVRAKCLCIIELIFAHVIIFGLLLCASQLVIVNNELTNSVWIDTW